MEEGTILLLDLCPKSGLAASLHRILIEDRNHNLRIASVELENDSESLFESAQSLLRSYAPELILITRPAGIADGILEWIAAIRRNTQAPLVIAAAETQPGELLKLLAAGASDFILSPFRAEEIIPRVLRLIEKPKPVDLLQTLKEKVGLAQLIGTSSIFREQTERIPSVSKCNVNVLITGETGTGKELFARAIHYLSDRAGKPFVPVNCGAIPVDLIENELFGHEKGAFTGAGAARTGLIAEAEGGALLLDEIDSLPLMAQVKLLRFLQEKEYRPLGSARTQRADVRVISATNIEPAAAVEAGRLRQDLYYRLNIIQFALPALRERREDIPLLARYFLMKYANEFQKKLRDISPEAISTLTSYSWPGNVRELEHVIERAVILTEEKTIGADAIILPECKTRDQHVSLREAKARVVEKFEKSYIQNLLQAYKGNISRASAAAKKNRRAFWQLIKKHQIDVALFKAGE